jgi:hypothetical protein
MNQPIDMAPDETPATDATFSVFLAYSDMGHERLGREHCEKLATSLTPMGHIVITEWKFEMLAFPALGEMAAEEAASADVVIVATSNREGLPHNFERWMERWCSGAGPLPILVAVVTQCESSPMGSCSNSNGKAQAKAHGIEHVIHENGGAAEESELFWRSAARRLNANRSLRVKDFPASGVLTGLANSANH